MDTAKETAESQKHDVVAPPAMKDSDVSMDEPKETEAELVIDVEEKQQETGTTDLVEKQEFGDNTSEKEKKVPRSLSDAEYDDIFTAAIERIMNTPQAVFEKMLGEKAAVAPPLPTMTRKVKLPAKDRFKQAAKEKAKNVSTVTGGQKSVKPRVVKGPPTLLNKMKPDFEVSTIKKAPKRKIGGDKDGSISKELKTSHEISKPKPRDGDAAQPNSDKTSGETRKVSSKELMINREVEEIGLWVQCSIASCNKWRTLKDTHDPTSLPEHWTCSMNPDPEQNTCESKEAKFDPETEQEDFIHTKFVEGSLVFARMSGYPWWPGLVEVDPDYQIFYECREQANVASHYHVTFLDQNVSRAWLGLKSLRPFTEDATMVGPSKMCGQKLKKDLTVARIAAIEALKLPLPERVAQYGFASRFRGKWGKYKEPIEGSQGACQNQQSTGNPLVEVDNFSGLSGEEVDAILNHAELYIESAQDALSDLLSSQSTDLDEFLPDSPPKKKAKKSLAVKVKKPKEKKAEAEMQYKPKEGKKFEEPEEIQKKIQKKIEKKPKEPKVSKKSEDVTPKAEKKKTKGLPIKSLMPGMTKPKMKPVTKPATSSENTVPETVETKKQEAKKIDTPMTDPAKKPHIQAKKPAFNVNRSDKPKKAKPKFAAPKVSSSKGAGSSTIRAESAVKAALETGSAANENYLDLVVDSSKPEQPVESNSAAEDITPSPEQPTDTKTATVEDPESDDFEE